jgi:imidazolonepropionase-like amidohydrolase
MTAMALAGVRVWDGVEPRTARDPVTIRIEDGKIAAVGPEASLEEDARVLRPGDDCVALPGLIDGHVHMTLDPLLRSPDEQLRVPPEELRVHMAARALDMLRSGITTARDLGGGAWHEIALRDAIARGDVAGPRLLCAGQPLTVPNGHCHFWGGVVDGPEAIPGVVARQVEHGADCIKVMATGGVITKGTSVREAAFEQAELEAVQRCAAETGRLVAAHCHGTEGIRRAVGAGLRTIEHCSFAGDQGFGSDLDLDVCKALGSQDTWVSPTVNAGWRRFVEDKDGKPTRFLENMREAFRALLSNGARLIASTDAGIPNVRHDRLASALEVLRVFTELPAVDVLRAATSESARALGIADVTGRIEPGLSADLLVVHGDPLEDLRVLESPALIVARGIPVPRA